MWVVCHEASVEAYASLSSEREAWTALICAVRNVNNPSGRFITVNIKMAKEKNWQCIQTEIN